MRLIEGGHDRVAVEAKAGRRTIPPDAFGVPERVRRATPTRCFIRSWSTPRSAHRSLADANPLSGGRRFNQIIVTAVVRRLPEIDFKTATAAGLASLNDPEGPALAARDLPSLMDGERGRRAYSVSQS
ncbi:MAG: hypothetical protein HY048_11570 [Acidobacteria bacterium]|nr:hypothetical protein [Acidobacteriota bacterium]